MMKTIASALVSLALLSGCASVSQPEPIALAVPLQISYQSEATLVRLGQLIDSGKYQNEQLSQLYYERGLLLTNLGLEAMARLDFSHSIRITPDFSPSYNFLGLFYLSHQELDNAYEAFDSAIELDATDTYPYFTRALALYYGHKYTLAEKDIQHYQASAENDPYRLVWQYLIQMHDNPKLALKTLQQEYQPHQQSDEWGWKIVGLYTGDISVREFIHLADNSEQNNVQLAQQLCEAYFYLAKKMQLDGKNELAKSYFKLSLSGNVYEYIEHRLALLELQIYDQQPFMTARKS
ncbi:lipoprotein NlpI [Celerinatantimonas sp. YJH-8]|uniref:lipoprotein NlpI n=1 Tax=Celerinatantimonas sp. YJH-8 TaxID=3228714 RepID=UPI0038C84F42